MLKLGFDPPEYDDFLSDIPNLKMMGQWIKKKGKILISGGYVKNGEDNVLTCDIELKAFINNP